MASPLSGRLIDRVGHRMTLLLSIGLSVLGIAMTLLPSVGTIVAGLALMATGVFCAASASQGFVGIIASGQRSTAAALYLSVYYTGGGFGAILPAVLWSHGGWPATVGLIFVVQIAAFVLALTVWPAPPTRKSAVSIV